MAGHWLAELDGSRVTVEVPASSANLGAGYDCLGLALAMVNRIEVEVRVWSRGEIELTVEGEGRNELTEDRDNRFVRGLEATLRSARGELPDGVGWRISMHNADPARARARIVRGGHGRRAPRRQRPRRRGRCRCRRCSRSRCDIEGHPDNAAAALLGGFVVSARHPGGVEAIRFDSPRDLRAVLFVPELRLPTDEMRAALPATVPLADAVANLGAVAVGVAGLATGRYDLLAPLTVDRLHEPYRAAVYPQLPRWSRPRVAPARSGRACRAPARRSSPSPIRWPGSPASRPPSSRRRPTSTSPAGSSSSSRGTPAPRWSAGADRRSRRASRATPSAPG